MRSRNRTKARRLFLALGSGTGAACSLEFLSLFVKAGFAVFPAIHESGLRWIAPEALRAVANHVPLISDHPPAWIHTVEDFDLAIGIGLPLSFFVDQTSRTDLFSECFFKKSRQRAVLLNPDVSLSDAMKQDLYCQTMSVQILPKEIGHILETLRQTFSDILTTFRRSHFAQKFSISMRRTIPEPLKSLAGAPPAWHETLIRLFQATGFAFHNASGSPEISAIPANLAIPENPANLATLVTSATSADLVLETYEGPFLKIPTPDSACSSQPLSITFSPDAAPPLPGTLMNIRFMHPQATSAMIESRTNLGEIIVIRQTSGDLLLFERSDSATPQKPARLIPHLSERPAHHRLIDHLLDQLLQARAIKEEASPDSESPSP